MALYRQSGRRKFVQHLPADAPVLSVGRKDEAKAVARLVLEAHRPFYGYCFRNDMDQVARFLEVSAADERSEIFAGRTLVARLNGAVAGMAVTLVSTERSGFGRRDAFLLRSVFSRSAADDVFSRMRDAARIFTNIDPASLYLARVAVSPELRSTGIGHLLIEAVKREAAARSLAAVELHLAADNQAALRFYQREGFREIERPTSTIPELPDYLRMKH